MSAIPNIWKVNGCKIELLNGDEIAITNWRGRVVHPISWVRFVDGSRWTNLEEYCDITKQVLQVIINGVKDIGFCGDTAILFRQKYDWDEIGEKQPILKQPTDAGCGDHPTSLPRVDGEEEIDVVNADRSVCSYHFFP